MNAQHVYTHPHESIQILSMATTSVRLRLPWHPQRLFSYLLWGSAFTRSLSHLLIIQFIIIINEKWWKLCVFIGFPRIFRVKETRPTNTTTTMKGRSLCRSLKQSGTSTHSSSGSNNVKHSYSTQKYTHTVLYTTTLLIISHIQPNFIDKDKCDSLTSIFRWIWWVFLVFKSFCIRFNLGRSTFYLACPHRPSHTIQKNKSQTKKTKLINGWMKVKKKPYTFHANRIWLHIHFSLSLSLEHTFTVYMNVCFVLLFVFY